MRNAQEVEVDISYSECGAETPFLPRSDEINKKNLDVVSNFLSTLPPVEMIKKKCFWRNISATRIAGFLNGIEVSGMNMPFMTDISGRDRPIISFIGGNEIETLASWDICLPQGDGDVMEGFLASTQDGNSKSIRPRQRQFEKVPAGADYLKLNRQRVGEIADEMVDLSDKDIQSAKNAWEEERDKDSEKGKTVPGSLYRRYRKRPLLTIHLIEPRNADHDSKHKDRMMSASAIESKVLVAVGLSFPKFEDGDKAARVPYRLNKVALRGMGLISDQEDDDDHND